jgi:putative colanic acid biosynthesis UDP-glucose lipid carrier transferase
MFLDENPSTEVLKNTLIEKKDLGYLIFEFKGDSTNLKEIKEFWKENGIHTMFIPSESNTDQKLKDKILKEAELSKVKVSLVPNISLSNYFQYDFEYIDTQPVLNPAKFPLDNYTNTF